MLLPLGRRRRQRRVGPPLYAIAVLLASAQAATRWQEKLTAEIDRSLLRYPRAKTQSDAAAQLRRTLWHSEKSVLVYDNRLFVAEEFLTKEKNRKHINFVASTIMAKKLPNVAYIFEGNSTGYCQLDNELTPHEELTPCLVIAKLSGYQMPGVMVPNPYFHDFGFWEAVRDAIRKRSSTRPWADRIPRVFWRGHILTNECLAEFGNHARLEAMSLGLTNKVVDVKCWIAKKCKVRDAACPLFPYDAAMSEASANPALITSAGHVAKENFSSYKYVLNLPGSTAGSYSRNLNHLWFTGAVVVLWQAPFSEWFYPALQAGETHISANKTTLVSQIKKVEKDKTLSSKLLANARRVDDELICPKCLADYFRAVVDRLRDRFKTAKVLDDPCRARDWFTQIDCSEVKLHEVFPTLRAPGAYDIDGRRRLLTSALSKPLGLGCEVLRRHAENNCNKQPPPAAKARRLFFW